MMWTAAAQLQISSEVESSNGVLVPSATSEVTIYDRTIHDEGDRDVGKHAHLN